MSRPKDEDGPAGPSLAPNPELEAALQEAADSVERAEREKLETDSDLSIDDELDRLRAEALEMQDRHTRLQADFENFRRRALKERQELVKFGHENLVKDLLSTVDNLERAIEHAGRSDGGDLASLLQGVELVERELQGILEKHAVLRIDAHGESFDPALHEAMAQAPDDSVAPNTVIEVLQKGYQLRERLLRPARVVVAKASEAAADTKGTEAGKGKNGEGDPAG
jgi:molecular chaperone GrpE